MREGSDPAGLLYGAQRESTDDEEGHHPEHTQEVEGIVREGSDRGHEHDHREPDQRKSTRPANHQRVFARGLRGPVGEEGLQSIGEWLT